MGRYSYRTEASTIGETVAPLAAIGRLDPPAQSRMNKTEARYAQLLDVQIRTGTVLRYWFEFVALRLADSLHYRPDFLVQLPDGRLELHEVKGAKKDGTFHVEEDSWAKIKMAAEVAPFPVYVVWPKAQGIGFNQRAI